MNALDVSSRPKLRKFFPTPEQAAAMESTRRSSEWYWQQPLPDIAKYANQNVAVLECQVVAVAPTLEELVPKLAPFDRSRLYIVPARRSRIRFRPA